MVLCNGGLHFHGLLLVPPTCRLKESVDEHVQNHRDLYLRSLADLPVRPVTHGCDRVVDYVFKTVLRGRVSYDECTLLLPRTPDEVSRVHSHSAPDCNTRSAERISPLVEMSGATG